LEKDCQPAPAVRKKREKRPPVSNTTALEEKLDGIVQLLQQQLSQASQSLIESPNSSSNTFEFRERAPAINTGAPIATTRGSSIETETATPSCKSYSTPSSIPIDYPIETEDECKEYLDTYRTTMVAYLPLVPIGPEVTVKEMREQHPFQWLVIRALCSKNVARQLALGMEFRNTLGRRVISRGERSVDVLLGLLIYSGWMHTYIKTNPIVTVVLQLAISLASDLGLNRSQPKEPLGQHLMNLTAQGCPKPWNVTAPRTMAERRTIIGLFHLNSM
jgi:hypothetical protein